MSAAYRGIFLSLISEPHAIQAKSKMRVLVTIAPDNFKAGMSGLYQGGKYNEKKS